VVCFTTPATCGPASEMQPGMVAPKGRLCLALYLKASFRGAWKTEKRLYAANRWLHLFIKWPHITAFLLRRQMVFS
jgi:hypothetical protein